MPSIDRQVDASYDDCRKHFNGSTWIWEPASAGFDAGYFSSAYYKKGSGARFTNITIPQGATITEAHLILKARLSTSNTTVKSKIRGEDVDDAATFSTLANYDGRPRTTAMVYWDNIPAWTQDTDYDSPDIKTIIQEIVNRANWQSGNDIVIFWDDHDDRTTHADLTHRTSRSYDSASAVAPPKLHIEYTIPTYTKTYTADALFKKLGLTKTLDADALFKAALTKELQSDALFQAQGLTKSFLAKAIFGGANIKEISADALFQQPGLTQELIADAIFKAVLLQQLTSDAIFLARPTVSFTASARFGEAGIASFLASVYFKKVAYHTILDGQYITETPEINRAYIIGRDAEGNPVYGTDHDQDEIDLVGERLDFQLELSIPTGTKAADVADAMLKKMRLTNKRGFILIPPNCGAELWDVIQITDKLCAQSGQKYRIIGIHFDYEPQRTHYHHRLLLGAV